MAQKRKLNSKKDKRGTHELIYGIHPVIELLRAKKRKLMSIYTTKPLPKAWERIKQYLPKSIPNIQYVSRGILDRMACSSEHMGIVALVSPFQFRKKMFDVKKHPFILLLDSIQDVHNLGAILRTAYCTGVTGIVLCKKQAAPLTAAAIKVSAGLAEHLDVYVAPSLRHAIQEAKQSGYNLYMTVLENGKNAMEVTYKKPMCLVIGNEAVGISKDVLKDGELITLPQVDPNVSYNASVAAGIFMFVLSQSKSLVK
jgi:23S rRNA (guanosine2251-2'-O)-methyltransferase